MATASSSVAGSAPAAAYPRFPGIVEELRKTLDESTVQQYVQLLVGAGVVSEQQLLSGLDRWPDDQVQKNLTDGGFKYGPALSLTAAILKIRSRTETKRQPAPRDADLPGSVSCPTLDELRQLADAQRPADGWNGLEADIAAQQERLGPFAYQDVAVVPFIRVGGDLHMDLRFAGFVDEKPEVAQLQKAGDVRMLQTSATGKTSAIFDYGRRNYLIYIRCTLPPTDTNEAEPLEFSRLHETIFPLVVSLIETHCDHKKVGIEKARELATGFILADLCARLCFLLWYTQAEPPLLSAKEKFLVAQLAGGQDIMLAFFQRLKFCQSHALQALVTEVRQQLAARKIEVNVALDEAQVAAAQFATSTCTMCFRYMGDQESLLPQEVVRGLLYQYTYLLKAPVHGIAANKVIVAGTGLIRATTDRQVSSQLAKPYADPVVFPVLGEEAVKARLSKMLNLNGLKWERVQNLSFLTGRCRWSAALIHVIEKGISELKSKNMELEDKEAFIDGCIDELVQTVQKQLAGAILYKLNSGESTDSNTERERSLLQTVFAICSMFQSRPLAVRVMLSQDEVDVLLGLGIGQLAGHSETNELMVFDKMTHQALRIVANKDKPKWKVTDIVAKKLIAARDNQGAAERGLNFQVVVAAALFEYNGSIADFADAVAKKAGETVTLPLWCNRVRLRATGFVSFDQAFDVRKFYQDPKSTKGIVCQPDNNHRGDGSLILDCTTVTVSDGNHEQVEQPPHNDAGGCKEDEEAEVAMARDSADYGIGCENSSYRGEAFEERPHHQAAWRVAEAHGNSAPLCEVVYSVGLRQAGGIERTDELASTFSDRAYELKPSTLMKNLLRQSEQKEPSAQRCGGNRAATTDEHTRPEEEDIDDSRAQWANRVHPRIKELTGGRRLRLHVNIGGYAAYASNATLGEYDTGINERTRELKKVHVDSEEKQVRVIIDDTNYDILFRSQGCRDIIAAIRSENEVLRKQKAARRKKARKAAL